MNIFINRHRMFHYFDEEKTNQQIHYICLTLRVFPPAVPQIPWSPSLSLLVHSLAGPLSSHRDFYMWYCRLCPDLIYLRKSLHISPFQSLTKWSYSQQTTFHFTVNELKQKILLTFNYHNSLIFTVFQISKNVLEMFLISI